MEGDRIIIDEGERKLRSQNLIPDGFEVYTNYDVRPRQEIIPVDKYVSELRASGNDVKVLDTAYDTFGKLIPTCVTILTRPQQEKV